MKERWVPPRLLAALPPEVNSDSRNVGQLFGHFDQQLARLAALDLVERLHDPDRAGRLHEAEDALCASSRFELRVAGSAGLAVEEKRNRHFERFADPLEPAGADPVHALLVLLHLLE